jgi:two-component system, response regulator
MTMAPVLLVDDDPEDQILCKEAFKQAEINIPLVCIEDGELLVDYLNRRPPFNDVKKSPLPAIILLDLNMPKMDGKTALKIIKSDNRFNQIPIIILTTSTAEEDIRKCYAAGANSFISKSMSFTGLVSIMKSINQYWLNTVELPYGR